MNLPEEGMTPTPSPATTTEGDVGLEEEGLDSELGQSSPQPSDQPESGLGNEDRPLNPFVLNYILFRYFQDVFIKPNPITLSYEKGILYRK